jgi:hypothetical protein
MHDLDEHLHRLLTAAAPTGTPPDRRPAIRATARRRVVRRRVVGAATAAGALCLGLLAVVDRRTDGQSVTAGLSAPQPREREVQVAGLDAPIRVSITRRPLAGYEDFGVVPLGDGVITGATQTTNDDGAPIALLAITLGPRTQRLVIHPSNGDPLTVDTQQFDEPALIEVDLEQRDPMLTLEIEALDASGFSVGSARVTPFVQDPLTCDTNPEMTEATSAPGGTVDADGPPGGATYVSHLDAYLGAPLPAVCD